MSAVDIMLNYAQAFVGKPYKWGGKGVLGIDCSGLVLEVLQAVGHWTASDGGDANAQGIFNKLRAKGWRNIAEGAKPQGGAIVFFGQTRQTITHIAICVNETYMIEAGGGGSSCNTPEDAEQLGALVRIRPIARRGDRVDVLVPN